MNRKGQTLIIFVILIPLILILAALVIDIGLVTNAKLKLSGVTTTVLKESYENRSSNDLEEKIIGLYKKNKIPTKNLTIQSNIEFLKIKNNYEIDSLFGKLIGIKNYKVSIQKKITKVNDEYKITKE